MLTEFQKNQLRTMDLLTDAAQGWNGIDNPAESTTVTITFDSHEQARTFARNFGHLLWLAWAVETYRGIKANQENEV